MADEVLVFNGPEVAFKKGINYTIRAGCNWARILSLGGVIPLALKNEGENEPKIDLFSVASQKFSEEPSLKYDRILGEAEIKILLICKLKDIPPFVYEGEHNKKVKNKDGLIKLFMEYYPDLAFEGFKEEIVVTCIGFEPGKIY